MTIIEISKNTFVIPNMKLKYKPTGNKKYFAFEPWSIMNGECMAFKYSHLCFHQFGCLMRYDYRLGVMKVHKDIMLNKDECFFNINQEIKLRLIIRDDNEPKPFYVDYPSTIY